MKREQTPTRSSENLTRGQKLLRRAVPLALITAGAIGGGVHAGRDILKDDPKAPEAFARATAHASAMTEFGGSDSGWTQGAAERVLQKALYEGATHAFANIQMSGADGAEFTISAEEIESIVDALPTYDQAGVVLDRAGIDEAVPDPGDTLSLELAVTADSNKHIEYEIVDAQIEDIPNNQH